jgi:hypothetical protein
LPAVSNLANRRLDRRQARVPTPEKTPEEREVMGLINGMTPQSIQEWRVAVSFWKYKLVFEYQVPIAGGRKLPGGRVLDFLVYNPFPIPVPTMEKYWHSGKKREDDLMMLRLLQRIYKREPVPLYGDELYSQEAADRAIRDKFNVGA